MFTKINIFKTALMTLLVLTLLSSNIYAGLLAEPENTGGIFDAHDSYGETDELPFYSFTYNFWKKPIRCPDPYLIEKTITGMDLGIGDFKKPNDLFADKKGNIYLAVSGESAEDNKILKFDGDLNLLDTMEGFVDEDGALQYFEEPLGVFVEESGEIYVADGKSKRIIHMDAEAKLIRIIGAPTREDSAIISDNFIERYRPSKLVVDSSDRLHVVAINVNEGIVEFAPDGKFEGFLAAGKVNPNPIEIIWKKISTREQLDRMVDFVPIEYNNIALDDEDFILATSSAIQENIVSGEIRSGQGSEQGALVRRLNMLGRDILRRRGFGPPVGDLDILDTVNNLDAAFRGISHIMDVATAEHGSFSVLDNNRSRIFTYDSEGFLLYAFGGPDRTVSGFTTPVSLITHGDRMYVLDGNARSISMFKQTLFARTIAEAIDLQEKGEYRESAGKWKEVLDLNANYDLAYLGIGKAMYRDGDYKEAMEAFKNADNRDWYSRAYKEYRKQVVAKWFSVFAYSLIGLALLIIVLSVFLKYFGRKVKKAHV